MILILSPKQLSNKQGLSSFNFLQIRPSRNLSIFSKLGESIVSLLFFLTFESQVIFAHFRVVIVVLTFDLFELTI